MCEVIRVVLVQIPEELMGVQHAIGCRSNPKVNDEVRTTLLAKRIQNISVGVVGIHSMAAYCSQFAQSRMFQTPGACKPCIVASLICRYLTPSPIQQKGIA
jgi:hypothetical protein